MKEKNNPTIIHNNNNKCSSSENSAWNKWPTVYRYRGAIQCLAVAIVKEYRETAARTITTIVISVLLFVAGKLSIPNSSYTSLKSHATFLHSSKSVQTSERAACTSKAEHMYSVTYTMTPIK